MKAWISMNTADQALKSMRLRGWLHRNYNVGIPVVLHLNNIQDEKVKVSVTPPGWSECSFYVPIENVDIEVELRGTSLPLTEFLQLRRWVKGVM